MVIRIFASKQLKNLFSNPLICTPFLSRSIFNKPSFCDVICKVFGRVPAAAPLYELKRCQLGGIMWIHSGWFLKMVNEPVEPVESSGNNLLNNSSGNGKPKRKKLKGKRAVVRWLKFFRWKKKKDYEKMTTEEKILYKLGKTSGIMCNIKWLIKSTIFGGLVHSGNEVLELHHTARNKEERLVEALKKIEPKESSETKHDPEILTPEEHFFFLKMGQKCKNYVPIGRRGIYQGVILNMHLHWKKHQTLQVVVKTFSPEEVKEIAVELARLSGGIVLDIQEDNTIIMYRGKNYSQPPTEIMSPRTTLPRKKALDKSKYRDGLRAVRKYIPRLEQDLELLRAKVENQSESKMEATEKILSTDIGVNYSSSLSDEQLEGSSKLQKLMAGNEKCHEDDDSTMHSGMDSDSEALSDIFETESDTDNEDKAGRYLYLDTFEKFPTRNDGETEDFEEHLRQISSDSKKEKSWDKNVEVADLDEVDRMVLRAASLLKKKGR